MQVHCYALSQSDGSEWRQRIEAETEHFLDVSAWSVPDIAGKLSADGIQVCINLNGYTKGARCSQPSIAFPYPALALKQNCHLLTVLLQLLADGDSASGWAATLPHLPLALTAPDPPMPRSLSFPLLLNLFSLVCMCCSSRSPCRLCLHGSGVTQDSPQEKQSS